MLASVDAMITSVKAMAAVPAVAVVPAPAEPEPEYLTTKQAAALLGVAPKSLENIRGRGAGSPFLRIGKAIRYRREDLPAPRAK